MYSILQGSPIFTENDRFNSTNQITFKNLIIIATEVQEAINYLNRTIKDSSTLIKSSDNPDFKLKPILLNIIFQDSKDPTAEEQKTRNIQAKDLLLYNIYDRSLDITKLHTKE